MDRFVRSFKVFWRAERFLRHKEFGLAVQKIQLNALAALVAVFGLAMLSLSVFYALEASIGKPLAALSVAGIDLVMALGLTLYAGSLKPADEVEIVREMRDTALKDIEQEVALVEAELTGLRDDAHRFIKNPIDMLLPSVIGHLFNAVSRGVRSKDKQASKDVEPTSKE